MDARPSWNEIQSVCVMLNRQHFSEKESRFFVACVIEAFYYIHTRGIVYRDLKPENLMLDERGYVKLVSSRTLYHIHKISANACMVKHFV
jgi:serine/threonine protein kinase